MTIKMIKSQVKYCQEENYFTGKYNVSSFFPLIQDIVSIDLYANWHLCKHNFVGLNAAHEMLVYVFLAVTKLNTSKS